LLREVASEIRLPAFAIGGIEPTNLDDVLATGISCVAVSSSVVGAASPATAASDFVRRVAAALAPNP
jgi:thiamine-phosphate pyrophosphorylase